MKLLQSFVFILTVLCASWLAIPASANGDDFAVPININQADADSLAVALKGIGRKKAEAIIAYRTAYGDFKSVEELAEIKGIGLSLVEQNRTRISLE